MGKNFENHSEIRDSRDDRQNERVSAILLLKFDTLNFRLWPKAASREAQTNVCFVSHTGRSNIYLQ